MTIRVLHIIQQLSKGGAARAMLGSAKYSREHAAYEHSVLSLLPPLAGTEALAAEAGVSVLHYTDPAKINAAIEGADIVQLEWWNDPKLDRFLRAGLPECRLASWLHVAGNRDPQYITKSIVHFSDVTVASSPQCLRSPAILTCSEEYKEHRTRLIYDCADFARVEGLVKKPHADFRVGYIGTVNYLKMHPHFLAMSAAANIPNVKFVVCGGDQQHAISAQARALGVEEKFEFKGYVDDIAAEVSQFDVYGYPLCEDTFASAELNLQEVMYAGIPPVVFPYGGIRDLVIHDFTGYVCETEREYTQALEYLYQNPQERERLGKNAKNYAEQIFGAKNAARKFHELYQDMLQEPKRMRAWGFDNRIPVWEQRTQLTVQIQEGVTEGTKRFIESLGENHLIEAYQLSLNAKHTLDAVLEVEDRVLTNLSTLMKMCGTYPYMDTYSEDPWLLYWGGLAYLGEQNMGAAATKFSEALQNGYPDWRALFRLAQCLKAMGNHQAYHVCLENLQRLRAECPAALEKLEEVST